jgi:hypothetical protein
MLRIIPVIFEIFRDPVYRVLIFSVVSILAFGTIFYSIVEDWSLLDSLYFCVVTLTTIGYGDFAPKTTLGKLVTIFYIFAGIGIIAAFIGTVADRMSSEGTVWQKFRGRRQRRHQEGVDDGSEVDV